MEGYINDEAAVFNDYDQVRSPGSPTVDQTSPSDAFDAANEEEVLIHLRVTGTKERKNYGRDLFVETEEQALMADGVALIGDHQIYVAEASVIYEPKLDKQVKDRFKLIRCMRDSWNTQIRSIAREAMPPTGLSVFGSTSFGDETKFYSMDYTGTYRLRQVGRMLVPLTKVHFGSRMETCVKSCLKFGLHLQSEIKRRTHLETTEDDLTATCNMLLVPTRTTPTKEAKKKKSEWYYGVVHSTPFPGLSKRDLADAKILKRIVIGAEGSGTDLRVTLGAEVDLGEV
ncbi:hypothetical protein EC968_000182 [Mortierella alpina]|nr:hypothetical protein EC968_000182 [Mortierella alpina]